MPKTWTQICGTLLKDIPKLDSSPEMLKKKEKKIKTLLLIPRKVLTGIKYKGRVGLGCYQIRRFLYQKIYHVVI